MKQMKLNGGGGSTGASWCLDYWPSSSGVLVCSSQLCNSPTSRLHLIIKLYLRKYKMSCRKWGFGVETWEKALWTPQLEDVEEEEILLVQDLRCPHNLQRPLCWSKRTFPEGAMAMESWCWIILKDKLLVCAEGLQPRGRTHNGAWE